MTLTIYDYIYNLITSFFSAGAIETYSIYINDMAFILTIAFCFFIAMAPLTLMYNLAVNIFYSIKPKRETRGRKKRD